MEIKNLNDSITFSIVGLTKRIVFDSPQVRCFVLSLMPGQSIPEHRHEESALTMTVLKGKGQARVNGKLAALTLGSILYLDGQDEFSIPVAEENLALLVTVSPNPESRLFSQEVNT
jgi:quercetin dioxygenase-like cupin family protein